MALAAPSLSPLLPDGMVDGRSSPHTSTISHVILDLDGTLLDTEFVVEEACREVVLRHGCHWDDGKSLHKRVGMRPLEAAALAVKEYALPCTAEEYLSEVEAVLETRWCLAKALPGARRLLQYLSSHQISMALASNSPRKNIMTKLSYHPNWVGLFRAIISADDIRHAKPSPDIFLEAAKQLNANPDSCLVIEDSPTGVSAGKAAGMKVIAVPSLPGKAMRHLYAASDHILSSLLDVKPEIWGLPPFRDWVANVLPVDPWYIRGHVIKGFGRGSKMLGIPTANLPPSAFSSQLAQSVCGVYMGWAALPNRGVFKMVTSIGWNPYFGNTEKTVEPWLLHEFSEDFYGEELKVIIVGYLRPEADFSSLEELVERIHEDARITKAALDVHPFSAYQCDKFLTSNGEQFEQSSPH